MQPDVHERIETADSFSASAFGGATFAAFDPADAAHRARARELRDRLCAIGFGPREAPALFGLGELSDFRSSRSAVYAAFVLRDDRAGRAARFFVLHDPLCDGVLRDLLGENAVAFLRDMAAIVPAEGGWRSIVSVTWFADNLIFADARAYNLIWPGEPFDDYVMPPGGDSIGLLHVAPRTPRRAAVDICCGAGAQTLAAAAYSELATGVDINARALRFARVNAAANGIENVRFVEGDCFDPLAPDERFDAILANPPFVPWPAEDAGLLYRGGGERGDDVIARILAAAVDRLDPDGSLAIVADFANTHTLPVRIRTWQARPRRTLILLQHAYDVVTYAETHAGHITAGPEREREVVRLLEHFRATGITRIDFGYIVQDGTNGDMFQTHTPAPRDRSIAADVAAFFDHQRRLEERIREDGVLALAPGLRVVGEVIKTSGGHSTAACYARPGETSMLEESTLSPTGFAVLDRVSSTALRLSAFTDPAETREARELLKRGLLRFAE